MFEPKTFVVSINMNITRLSKLISNLRFEPKTFVVSVNMNIIDRDIFHMIFFNIHKSFFFGFIKKNELGTSKNDE